MNKNGFTLVELLGVITLLAIITIVASFSVSGVTSMINKSMWENKVNLIENGAERYGEQNSYALNKSNSCTFNVDNKDETHEKCMVVTVQYLIERGFVSTDERENGEKVIKNNTNDEIVNNHSVYVWLENNVPYAKYVN